MLARAEIGVFIRVLRLDEHESRVFVDVYDAYLAEWRQGERAMRAEAALHMEEAELLQTRAPLSNIGPLKESWKQLADELDEALLNDLAALLTREQERLWPIAEREIRRIRRIEKGVMSAERVDVIRLVDHVVPREHITPTIDELLERYSQDLDAALIRRDRFVDEHSAGFHDLVREDTDRAETLFIRARRLRLAVCEANERAARQIAAELPEEIAARLHEEFDRRAYEMYLQPTHFDRQIAFVNERITLGAEQRAAFDDLYAHYREREAELHRREIAERRRIERDELPAYFARARAGSDDLYGYGWDQWGEDSVLMGIRRDRLALDRRTRERLGEILTHQQLLIVPDGADEVVRSFSYWRDSPGL